MASSRSSLGADLNSFLGVGTDGSAVPALTELPFQMLVAARAYPGNVLLDAVAERALNDAAGGALVFIVEHPHFRPTFVHREFADAATEIMVANQALNTGGLEQRIDEPGKHRIGVGKYPLHRRKTIVITRAAV